MGIQQELKRAGYMDDILISCICLTNYRQSSESNLGCSYRSIKPDLMSLLLTKYYTLGWAYGKINIQTFNRANRNICLEYKPPVKDQVNSGL